MLDAKIVDAEEAMAKAESTSEKRKAKERWMRLGYSLGELAGLLFGFPRSSDLDKIHSVLQKLRDAIVSVLPCSLWTFYQP